MRVHWLLAASQAFLVVSVASPVASADEEVDEEPSSIREMYPAEEMTAGLRKTLPGGGKNLRVEVAGNAIVISGQVFQPADVERATHIVEGMATVVRGKRGSKSAGPEIINALSVAGDHQVQLEVSFAEVSRTALKAIGLNFWNRKSGGDGYAGGLIGPGSTPASALPSDLRTRPDTTYVDNPEGLDNPDALPLTSTPLTDSFGVMFATAIGGKFPVSVALSVLSRRGFARTLSEPTLVAMSGEEASFLAGGEAPIPVPQGLGQVGIEYKRFGVQLSFTPVVLNDTIQLKLVMGVSDLNASAGISVAGTRVPEFITRESKTTIRLRDGQSFAIAGLLSDSVRSTVDKVPLLGDLPVLGTLFRSLQYQRSETELLVVVTAHIVRPLEERPGLPGQYATTDPSDLELFLLGSIESKGSGSPPPQKQPAHGGPDASLDKPTGPVGFAR